MECSIVGVVAGKGVFAIGFDREVCGAQDRSATHNSANLPDYLDFGVYHT